MPKTDRQQVYRNVHHPDGIMINGKAHDLAKKENAIFTNCLKIVTSATMHNTRFVIEGPVSLAQASPYVQRCQPRGALGHHRMARVRRHRGRPPRRVRHVLLRQ